MKIGILKTGHPPDPVAQKHGGFDAMFQRLLAGQGFTFETWDVEHGDFPDGPEAADGWLITGSRHGAYEDHVFIPPLEDLIRAIHASGRRLVGICFGHQIIAQAMGGRVERYQGGWAVGPQDYDFGGEKITLNAWHRDQVVERPEGAEVAGCNDFCENAALVYGDTAYTVQAHPEFSDDFVAGLMRTRGKGVVPDPLMEAAMGRLGPTNDAARIADRIAEFFLKPRAETAPNR